ncbi:hypothetical protein [Nocardiopsis halotolerans]|uniref:hypothetical protein n=1 Tax=Nocardiopsis halotolerans TaxID=124252 RepID=UPI0003488E74|nr:hypothetical protein [Nocardiopsis halotolerans]
MHHVQDDLVLRPSLRAGWVKLGFAAVACVLPTAEVWVSFGPGAGLVAGAVLVVLVALVAAHLHRARIVLTPREIVLRGAFFRRRRSLENAVWTIRATIVQPNAPPADNLFLLDAHGGVLLRVHGTNYTTEDVDRLVHALGLPCSGPEHPVSPKELQRYRPGLVTWAEQHAFLLGVAFAVVLTLVIAVAVLVGVVLTME